MTKSSKKNLILWLGISTGFAAVFGTSAALYFSAGDLKNIADKKEYLIRSSEPLTLGGYHFDSSATYGPASTKTPESLMASNLVREKTIGETKFVKDSSGKNVVSQSSTSKLTFELAQELILTFKKNDNSAEGNPQEQVIFNNDDAEKNASIRLVEKPETIALRSDNKKSINSDYFDSILLGKANFINGELVPDVNGSYSIEGIGFTVRDDISWVDHNGNETKYKINVRDFYYSYMRTWLFDTKYRRSNGGSETLDQYFIELTSTTTRFTNEKEYPNDYLLGLFGVDAVSLRDESKTIKQVDIDGVSKQMFSVTSLSGAENPNFSSLFKKSFLNSFLLSAAPSQFIDELVAKNQGTVYPTSLEKGEKITGDANKFGIYIYGQRRNDNLFASAYVPVSAEENRIIFKKNIYFANKEFLAETDTLERIIFEHSSSPTFNDQLFNNFFEGTVSEMPYNSLTQQQKIKIFGLEGNDEFASEKGLLQIKQLNKAQLVQRTLLTTDPRKFGANETGNYYFNESYANVMYGSTIEQLKSGTAKTTESFFNGAGFELRTLLNASINWFTFINNSTKGLKQLWLNRTAPNAMYSSSVDSTPFDNASRINDIGYFKNGEKITITEAEMKKTFLDNSSSIDEQYKNKGFADIKVLVGKLLTKAGITASNPLEWQIVYPHADASSNKIKIDQLDMVVKTIKQLDSRLNPSIYVPNNRDEMMQAVNDNKAISDFNGWGYDYEGIGSFLDGISHGKGISLLGAFSLYSDVKNTMLRKQSPEFAKLSDSIKKLMNPGLPKNLKVENWIDFTNDDNNNLESKFGDYAISTELAKFFLGYQEELNKDQITNLIIELNVIAGFTMESDISIDDSEATSLSLVLPEYLYPTTESGILYLSDIRLGDKNV